MDSATATRGNLPAELTSFVGRRRHLQEVKAALTAARLVSRVGTGRAARDLAEAEAIFADWHPRLAVVDMDHDDSTALLGPAARRKPFDEADDAGPRPDARRRRPG